MRRLPDLWRCPGCGAAFTTRNQRHSCGRFDLAPLFSRSEPHVRRLYEQFIALAERCGPIVVTPQKSRIAVQVRMRFAALTPRKSYLAGHLIMRTSHEAACFETIEEFTPRCYRHAFRLRTDDDLRALAEWMPAAYRAGAQEG